MRVLDLFSGLGGWSKAFKKRGHDVLTLDIDKTFKPDVCMDILKVKSTASLYNENEAEDFDVILASPPCPVFSLASGNYYWDNYKGQYYPKKFQVSKHIAIAWHTFYLLYNSSAKFFVIENPRGHLRRVVGMPQAEIAYCQYGFSYRKLTDLWGKLPPSFIPKTCDNRLQSKIDGSLCRHTARNKVWKNTHDSKEGIMWGSHTKKGAAKRGEIPYGLSLAMCKAMERDLNAQAESGRVLTNDLRQ